MLDAGSYGTFTGAMKSGTVTLGAQAGVTATMGLNLNPATNITIDGLRLTDVEVAETAARRTSPCATPTSPGW